MTTETALPTGEAASAAAAAGEQAQQTQAAADTTTEQQAAQGQDTQAGAAGEEAKDGEQAKKEKTPEQREIERLRRRVDNLTRQKYELRAGQQQPTAQQERTQANDDEPVTLSRAELQKMITEQANKLAPVVSEQQAEIERRGKVVQSLAKSWGQEEFDAKASDLDAVFGGIVDAQGRPRPATDAIFDADDPKAVIEYLTDPDNADEAESIARLPALRAGREIARIEQKLKEAAAKAKPQPSNAAKPVSATKGAGVSSKDPSQMTDAEFAAWRHSQIKQRR